jgi:hypothetical protein
MLAPLCEGTGSAAASGPPPTIIVRFWNYYTHTGWYPLPNGTSIGRYVQVAWSPDPNLEPLWDRDPATMWPATDQEWLTSWQLCWTNPAQIQMPQAGWNRLKRYPTLYCRGISAPRRAIPNLNDNSTYDWEWGFGPFHQVTITRVPPIADAGAPRPFFVDVDAGVLREDLVLDGGRSYDPDGDPLSFQWEIVAGPCTGSLPWQVAQFSRVSAIALRAGTPMGKECLGTYTFKLTVRDPQAMDVSSVQHTLAQANRAPIADAGGARTWQLRAGYRLATDVVLDGSASRDPDGDPLSYGWQLQTQSSNFLALPWQKQNFTQSCAVALTAGTQIPRECLGPHEFQLTVTDGRGGVNSSRVQHTFAIAAPTLTITCPKAIELHRLSDGITVDIEEKRPDGAVVPDAYELQISDAQGTRIAALTVSAKDLSTPQMIWRGESQPGYGLPPAVYKLQVVALTEGFRLAESNVHQLRVVDFDVTILGEVGPTKRSAFEEFQKILKELHPERDERGPDKAPVDEAPRQRTEAEARREGGSGGGSRGTTTWPPLTPLPVDEVFGDKTFEISAEGPEMPQLEIRIAGRGFPPGHVATWQARVTVTYRADGRSDVVSFPRGGGWKDLTPPGSARWELAPTEFCGGFVTAFCQTLFDGIELTGNSLQFPYIFGLNPSKQRIRAEFSAVAHQVVAYLESRFTQFSSEADLAKVDQGRQESATVLRTEPLYGIGGFRYGIGGLREPVTASQLWNWRDNVAETTKRLEQCRKDAVSYQEQVRGGQPWDERTGGAPPNQGVAYSDVPIFTEHELDLEMFARYRTGLRYHDYVPDVGVWMRREDLGPDAGASLAYAEQAADVRDAVRDERFPEGWSDPVPFEETQRLPVDLDVIRMVRMDARSSQALDELMDAGWRVRTRRLTVLKPFRADFDARELLIDDLPVSNQLRALWLVGAMRLVFKTDRKMRLRSESVQAIRIFTDPNLLALQGGVRSLV